MSGIDHAAGFVAGLPAEAIPAEARELATLALVDFVGAALAGAREPVARVVLGEMGDAPGGCTVIGHSLRVRPTDAAFANATIGHALDFDDSNMVLGGHPSVTLLPAVLALGEKRGASGREVLDAYVVGFEVMMAVAKAVNFAHYEKGWHPTATLGTFGVAAASARLLGLDARRSGAALGLAASMASGIKAAFGTMAKPLQVGEASRRGLLCALLAAEGATAPPGVLEAKQGFFNVYNGAGLYRAEALGEIGDGFEILRSGIKFKKYACCGSTHAPIDAALALRQRHGLSAAEIASVEVRLNPRRRPHVDRPVVADELAAKFSVQFTVAAALADGAVKLHHFAPETIAREDLQALTARVVASDLAGGEGALSQGCELVIRTRGGADHNIRLADAEGRDAGAYRGFMDAKFADCCAASMSPAESRSLYEALLGFEGSAHVGPVMARLAAGRSVPSPEPVR